MLKFNKISVREDYRKEWNIHENDFILITKDNIPLRNTLYRIGGLNDPKLNTNEYFLLIKHVEAFYSKDILRMSKTSDPKHLEGRWCILDKDGNEKIEFPAFKCPHIIKDSLVYSIDGEYYNIETGEHYCRTSNEMVSKDFIFLENRYDNDKSKRGILKINKKDGSFELFK